MLRKIVCSFMVLGLCFVAVPVMAEFKMETQTAVNEVLKQFYEAERGNRLTSYSMDGLIVRLNQIFRINIIIPKPPEKKAAPPEVPKGK